MFKHEVENNKEYGEAEENVEKDVGRKFVNNVKEVREEEMCTIVDIDDPDDMEHDEDVSNKTFLNPSQDDNLSSANNFKCDMCDFSSTTQSCTNDHKQEKHNYNYVIQALAVKTT